MPIDGSTQPDIDGGSPTNPLTATRIDIVVDVQAASQHGGPADMAHQRATLIVGGTLLTTEMTVPVFDDGAERRLTVHTPPAWAALDGTFTTIVLLPAETDAYRVELVSWTEEYDPQVFDGVDLPHLAGRAAIAWRGTGSAMELIYQLLPPGR